MFESKTEIAGGNFECQDIDGRMYLWKPAGQRKDLSKLSWQRVLVSPTMIRPLLARVNATFSLRGSLTKPRDLFGLLLTVEKITRSLSMP